MRGLDAWIEAESACPTCLSSLCQCGELPDEDSELIGALDDVERATCCADLTEILAVNCHLLPFARAILVTAVEERRNQIVR